MGSSGGGEVGVGSAGRGVSVGGGDVGRGVGGDVGRAVGGAWVAVGCRAGIEVGGMFVGPDSDRRVGVLDAIENGVGKPVTGVRITLVGVRNRGSSVCDTTTLISGVSDRTAALILLLNNPCGVTYASQRPGPSSPSLYALMVFASSNPRSNPYSIVVLPYKALFSQSLASIIGSTIWDWLAPDRMLRYAACSWMNRTLNTSLGRAVTKSTACSCV